MNWLLLEGLAETPIALPRRAEAGNLYETLPEIPGTAMRGAIARRYIRRRGWRDKVPDDEQGKKFERVFESIDIRFGSLRPVPDEVAEKFSSTVPLPVPRSARSCKYDGGIVSGHGVFDSLIFLTREEEEVDPKKRKCPVCKAPLEALDSTWILADWNEDLTGGTAFDYDPTFHLSTHVGIGPAGTRDADLADEGRLFSLQHFPAGTKFRGWIAIGDSEVSPEDLGFEKVGERHEMMLRVGRRSKSYGALRVQILQESCQHPWIASHGELGNRLDAFQDESIKTQIKKAKLKLFDNFILFALTCVTDLILLDDFLRPCRSITAHQIAQRLQLDESNVQRISLLTGTRVIGGWNAAHRLPKESDGAIVAGSVFLFAVNAEAVDYEDLKQKLADMENNGLGWRRSEGFGQVLICDPFHIQAEREFAEKDSRLAVRLEPPELESPSREGGATTFEPEIWNFLVRNSERLYKNREKITKTQINSLRDRVQRYDHSLKKGCERKRKLLEYIEHAQNRSKQGCWDLEEKWHEEKQPLADALIKLFGLKDNDIEWSVVSRRVDQFVRGAIPIISSDKQIKLKCGEGS